MKTLFKTLLLLTASLTAAAQVTVTCPQLPCDIHVVAPANVPPPVSTKFKVGDRVVVKGTTGSVSVRAVPSVTAPLVGSQAEGKLGTISAPAQKDTLTGGDGAIRWNVDYDAGVDGWSLETYLSPYVLVPPVLHTNLTWDASVSIVIGYNVYRATTTGGPYTRLNNSVVIALSFKDPNTVSGTYFYVVKAVGTDGTESPSSNQVTAVLP